MKLPRKRENSIVPNEIANLIKTLSGLDKETFDKRASKALQVFFGDVKVTWVAAPVVVQVPIRLRDSLHIFDNHGATIAFVILSRVKKAFKPTPDIPTEWPLIEKIVSGLYQSAVKLSAAKELAFQDDVTQLYNQRYLHMVLDKEIRRSERSRTHFSTLFIDIDHFKNVNDNKGHLVGSQLLYQISKILTQNIRIMDYGFRYGGDEFILLLIGTNKESALAVGERIRKQVESTIFTVENHRVHITLSIGVASFPEHAKTKEDILRMADEAMYEGKNKSRNIVNVAS